MTVVLPTEVMNELLTLVRVDFNKDGGLTHLAYPSDRELNKALPLIGGRNLPHSLDEIRAGIDAAVKLVLPKWRNAALSGGSAPAAPKPKLPAGVERFFARPDDDTPAPDTGAAALEARVRMMSYDELSRLCAANGLTYPTEAPNRGVLVMRARNCVYNALRAGRSIQWTE